MPTLAQFRNQVASKLGLDNTTESAEQNLIDDWVNDGVVEVLLRTHCTVESGTMAVTSGTWQYQLDTDILAIRDIWKTGSSSNVEPIIRVTEPEIFELQRTAGSSDAAYLRYATAGANMLLLWPTPTSAYTLNLLYVPRPLILSDVNHDPSVAEYGRIPTEFHKAIEYYALWQGAEYDENQGSQGGERFRALFEENMASRIRPAMKRKGGLELPQVRRGSWRSRRHGGLRRDPDRY